MRESERERKRVRERERNTQRESCKESNIKLICLYSTIQKSKDSLYNIQARKNMTEKKQDNPPTYGVTN